MGEIALRKIQAAIESSRGLAVAPPTRPIYGKLTMGREQGGRFANEDRGSFVKYFRRNPKLIEATFKLESDVTPEDFPYWCEMFMQGGVSPTGSGTTGYLWVYAPDIASDLIKTRTFYAGDDTVQWQGPFGVADTMEVTMDLGEAWKFDLNGFVRDWLVYGAGFSALADRTVESVMGWQSRLFVDAAGGVMGTTQVIGKFIASKLGYKLDNKRKPFGDGLTYALQKLGRGERDVSVSVTFEGLNTVEFTDHQSNVEKLVRIQLIGSAIPATTFGTTNGALTAGATVTSIPTNALTSTLPGGVGIVIGGQPFSVTPAGAASGATSIPVQSAVIVATIGSGATIMAAKTINFDFWGYWDTFGLGERETNTTFTLNLVGVYDQTAGYDHKISVVNQNNLAAGIT